MKATPTPEKLKQALELQFPPDATSWAQATDEVRDMSRYARELADLPECQAVNFREVKTPSEWNTKGIESIIKNFSMLNERDRDQFYASVSGWLTN